MSLTLNYLKSPNPHFQFIYIFRQAQTNSKIITTYKSFKVKNHHLIANCPASLILFFTAELSLAPLKRASNHPVANLSNLLPTGTVLAVQTFVPSFSNNGLCRLPNKYLTAVLISVCAAFCILSSFTGTFVDSAGKLHYGIATFRGLYIFNLNIECDNDQYGKKDLERFKLRFVDFVHAFVSLLLLIFARGDLDVQGCYFSQVGTEWNSLFMNLSLGAGAFCTFLFTIFPTTCRGIGYTDINAHSACSC